MSQSHPPAAPGSGLQVWDQLKTSCRSFLIQYFGSLPAQELDTLLRSLAALPSHQRQIAQHFKQRPELIQQTFCQCLSGQLSELSARQLKSIFESSFKISLRETLQAMHTHSPFSDNVPFALPPTEAAHGPSLSDESLSDESLSDESPSQSHPESRPDETEQALVSRPPAEPDADAEPRYILGVAEPDADAEPHHGLGESVSVEVATLTETAQTRSTSPVPSQAESEPKAQDHPESVESTDSGWLDLPSSRFVPYWKPDHDTASLRLEDGREILGASRRGRSHAHTGTCRDDDMLITRSGDWLLLAVCDGAGSAPFAREGSRLACERLNEHFQALRQTAPERFDALAAAFLAWQGNSETDAGLHHQLYALLGELALEACKALIQEAAACGDAERSVRDYATTLCLAIVTRFETGTAIGTFSVGDSIAGLIEAGEARLLTLPDSGEYAGQTRFLTSPNIFQDGASLWPRFGYAWSRQPEALLLMTDGVSDARFGHDQALRNAAVWRALWAEIQAALQGEDAPSRSAAMLAWLDFHVRGEHDDRTLVVLR